MPGTIKTTLQHHSGELKLPEHLLENPVARRGHIHSGEGRYVADCNEAESITETCGNRFDEMLLVAPWVSDPALPEWLWAEIHEKPCNSIFCYTDGGTLVWLGLHQGIGSISTQPSTHLLIQGIGARWTLTAPPHAGTGAAGHQACVRAAEVALSLPRACPITPAGAGSRLPQRAHRMAACSTPRHEVIAHRRYQLLL